MGIGSGIIRLLPAFILLVGACTPRRLVQHMARTHPGCLYEVATREKVVALTIDDGPDSLTTPKLLQLLKQHNAQATFFLITDRIAGNDSLVAAMLEQQHEIGNHFSRNGASIRFAPPEFSASFLRADSALRRFAPMKFVRPGSGFYNERMLRVFAEHKYQCALGSVYPFDPQLPIARYASHIIMRHVYPGAVIILHDGGYKGRNTEQVLRRILPALTRRGYRVVTLTELVARDTAGAGTPHSVRR